MRSRVVVGYHADNNRAGRCHSRSGRNRKKTNARLPQMIDVPDALIREGNGWEDLERFRIARGGMVIGVMSIWLPTVVWY